MCPAVRSFAQRCRFVGILDSSVCLPGVLLTAEQEATMQQPSILSREHPCGSLPASMLWLRLPRLALSWARRYGHGWPP
jgi:hypothetical protein